MTRLRLASLGFFFLVMFSLIIFRAVRLQLFPHIKVESLARRQLVHRVDVVARRGSITDRNGRELAVSTNSVSVFANPKLVKNPTRVARVLSPILGVSEAVIKAKLEHAAARKFVWLGRQLDSHRMELLGAVDLKTIEGIGVLPEFRREFPQKQLGAHVLGFVSVDGNGLEGIEKQFQKELVGERETVTLSRDALGRPLFSHQDQIKMDVSSGSDVELTIDSRLQYSVEHALKDAVEEHAAEGGTAIVMEPNTGEILALANYPAFDPNDPAASIHTARRNRAITDPIEPGSVLKPFVVARALEEKVVTPESIIPTYGGFIKVGKKTIGEADVKHRLSQVSVVDLIRISSNVGTVVLKQKLGWERIEDTYRKLGFGSQLGIELGGESRGIFNSPKPEQLLEQATMSFGQGISLTPLQIAQAYAVVANGGLRVKPHVVRQKPTSVSGPESTEASFVGERVFSSATTEKVRQILEKVVEGEGTGVLAKVEGFRVAGKTGTSQKVDYRNGGYERGAYWSSFAGFIPSQNPRFVITVVIDKPSKNGYYGGAVAAPVFSKIAQAAVRLSQGEGRLTLAKASNSPRARLAKFAYQRLNYPSAHDDADSKVDGTKANKTPNFSILKSRNSSGMAKVSADDKRKIPEVVGLPLANALHLLQSRGLRSEIMQSGDMVVEQMPAAGSDLPAGGTNLPDTQKVYLKLR